MYISEITIEGFKSYASRVTLSNFDKSFNAITGLNGSGKSNVLDAVCFVLGIKNLAQVRAHNLLELIYKQGQAGITKATVSITWHNDDKSTSPPGFEDKERITVTRTIVAGGRNKYQINGAPAQETRVQDFFHSVQLNVNNPHFLIMQGRITKVLNMKPPEILSLLEEAAGTRMYEKKKEAALNTLKKKQARLDQIDAVLNDDIKPALKDLKEKCGQYEKWAGLETKKDKLKRLVIAYEYTQCIRHVNEHQNRATEHQQTLANLTQQQDELKAQLVEGEELIKQLQAEKDIQSGGEIKELQARVDALQMELTKATTHWTSKKKSYEAEMSALQSLQASAAQLAAQDLPAQLATAEKQRDEAAAALTEAQAGVEAAQRELAGAEAGDGRDHTNRSLKERLVDAQRDMTTAEANYKAATVRAKLLKDQLTKAKKDYDACGKEAAKDQAERRKQEDKVKECQARLQALGYDAPRAAELESARTAAAQEVRSCRERVEQLTAEVAGCGFKYSNPGNGFRAEAVHGVLARLVQVRDPSTSIALEVAAGGKLFQVVVDDHNTAKQLLDKGQLTRRVTIIPLNKIQYPSVSNNQLKAADSLSKGRAKLALELVGYEEEVTAAMKYAFGNAFVCETSDIARKLAFSRDVGVRCVTLEGDDFNPSGLLTGGTRNVSKSVLASLHALAEAETALAAATEQLNRISAELQAVSMKSKEHSKLERDVALAQHSLVLLEERLEGTKASQMAATVKQLETELQEAETAAAAAKTQQAELAATCKSLESEMSTFASGQSARIKAAQNKLKAAKAVLDKAKAGMKAAEGAVTRAKAELEGAASEQEGLAAKIQEAQAAVTALEKEAGKLETETAKTKQAFEKVNAELQTKRARLKECDADMSAREKALSKVRSQIAKLEGDSRKVDNSIKKCTSEVKRVQDHVDTMEKDFQWVTRDKAQFGTGDYDFSKHKMDEVSKQYENLEVQCGELKGKVNSKNIDKLQRAESEYNSLMTKRDVVENDRNRITEVIDELDDKKRQAMEETWKKVDKDFGSIFSTLLPGTFAKLEPPEGLSFQDGLEVRVRFGSVWKQSLTELSGGQRSLLALSLILALCRFKPAPLYILDEVDSALDLNHTQNIGRMIRQHFPQSQFLVVSLKEGMFSNANVIFRTKFVDGVSTITRTVPSAAEAAMRGAQHTESPR